MQIYRQSIEFYWRKFFKDNWNNAALTPIAKNAFS